METVNQEQTQEERTFTQAELDAIVSDRLKRDRAKYSDYEALKEKAQKFDEIEEKSKTELEKATERATALQMELDSLKRADQVRSIREKVSTETGVPVGLLNADTEEECKAQAAQILDFAKPSYPNVKDGGEVRVSSKGSTRQQFAEWASEALQ